MTGVLVDLKDPVRLALSAPPPRAHTAAPAPRQGPSERSLVPVTSSHTHRPSAPLLDHDCSPELCSRGPREIAHREVPEQFTPHNEGDPRTPTVHWSVELHEELDPGGYLAGISALAVLGIGSELATMSLDELGRCWRALAELEQRGRRLTADPASAA